MDCKGTDYLLSLEIVAMWTALVVSNSRGGIVSMLANVFPSRAFHAVRQHHDSESRGREELATASGS